MDKIVTIFIKKADFEFAEKETGFKENIELKSIEEYKPSHYKIEITEEELEAMAQILAHSCDSIKSDRKAARLDGIALMLENYL